MAKKNKTEAAKMQVINKDVLVQLIKKKAENRVDIATMNGDLGAKIKHHKDLSNLNPWAFAAMCKLNSMKMADREEARTALDLYCDMAEETGLWEAHVGDLASMAEAAHNAEQHDSSDDEQNFRPPHLIAQEAQRLDEEAHVASNVRSLRSIRGMPGADAAGPSAVAN
jgi:hypothetical protein